VRIASRLLLALSALILAGGAVIHALAYPKAAVIADHSTLPAFLSAAFKGLWLCDSLTSIGLALPLGVIAALPTIAARPLVILLALPPLAFAWVLFATLGNFFAAYLMLLAGAAALAGGLLHGSHSVGLVRQLPQRST
jgi:hypothetical protein